MLGTMRPCGVSVAMPMLCEALYVTAVQSAFTCALIMGNSVRACEAAFIRSGMKVSFVLCSFPNFFISSFSLGD